VLVSCWPLFLFMQRRTSKLSPMQTMTLKPPSIAALVLRATN
jgi:hypothetical protein